MVPVPLLRRALRIPILPPETSSFPQTTTKKASDPMADQPPSVQFEDVPLDEARRMG
jgi:hypothetical protein